MFSIRASWSLKDSGMVGAKAFSQFMDRHRVHQPIVPAAPLNIFVTCDVANLVSGVTDDCHSSFCPVRWHKQQANDCRYQTLQSIFCRVS